jgi:hypothetical protein
MIRRQPAPTASRAEDAPAFDDFHDWVLSLPWVIERPYSVGTPGVRTFAVECEPLGLRQLWLVTGLRREREVDDTGVDDIGVAVIVPLAAATAIGRAGWGRRAVRMPARHVMVTLDGDAVVPRGDIEALVLTAYSYAMS